MTTKGRSMVQLVGYLGIMILILACAGLSGLRTDETSLRLTHNAIEVRSKNGGWTSVAKDFGLRCDG